MKGIYLLTFCSNGENGGGNDLSRDGELLKSLLSPFFDEVYVYSNTTLKEISGAENFCNPQPGNFPLNPGLSQLGCGDFKSIIIDHTLGIIPEGSILLYHDCNFGKYPQYWQTQWESIGETCDFLLNSLGCDYFFPFEYMAFGEYPTVSMHGKRHTTEYIIEDPKEADIVSRCYEIASSRMIIRNTASSREFFGEYKQLCSDKDLLRKFPDPNPYPNFTHLCPEQHVLNCLVYKKVLSGDLPPDFPRFTFKDRIFRIDENIISCRLNEEMTKYMFSKLIENKTRKKENYGNDIRRAKEFREDIFST